jgi:hypothetical protein
MIANLKHWKVRNKKSSGRHIRFPPHFLPLQPSWLVDLPSPSYLGPAQALVFGVRGQHVICFFFLWASYSRTLRSSWKPPPQTQISYVSHTLAPRRCFFRTLSLLPPLPSTEALNPSRHWSLSPLKSAARSVSSRPTPLPLCKTLN